MSLKSIPKLNQDFTRKLRYNRNSTLYEKYEIYSAVCFRKVQTT
jgi:hypothetical protein